MEVFKILGRIAIDGADQAKKEVDNLGESAEHSSTGLKKLGSVMKGFAEVTLKASIAAAALTTTTLAALTKSAVQNYAEYEQLVGGVETLFKDSSGKVMEYAKEAYKTSGLSANAYMETVTGFTASLLQSLGGDTEKAADIADMALKDMSDNANKMGTSMESIQNAYQGFAKQNYTMLDNLKLGYGGTKSEMERLLEDAEKLKAAHGEMVEYSIDSYADIIDAIHTVQDEMDITGTTAKEASTTIQGSFGMMKAAWTNFLTGMADEKQDFNKLLDELLDSIVTFGNNIIPRIMQTVPRLTKGLSQLAKKIAPYIPKAMNELIPALLSGAQQILSVVVKDLPSILETLLGGTGRKLGETISSVVSELVPMVMDLAESLLPLIVDAVELFGSAMKAVIPIVKTVVQAIDDLHIIDIISGVMNVASGIISALTFSFQDNTQAISDNVKAAKEEAEQARENLQSYRDMKAAIEDKVAADLAQLNNTERLWKELQTLCDEQGNVSEADKARAEFIIGELNDALGTEIEMTDNQIQNYNELTDSVTKVIETKKAEIYFKAYEEEYAEAIKNRAQIEKEAAEQSAQIGDMSSKKKANEAELYKLNETHKTRALTEQEAARKDELLKEIDDLNWQMAEIEGAYNANRELLSGYYTDINAYEEASVAMQEGRTQDVINILDSKGQAYLKAADLGRQATEEEKKQFLEQAQSATATYKMFREEYEKGTAGFTEEMVKNAEKNMQIAWEEYSAVGGAMVDGITAGANSQSSVINDAIMNIVRNAMSAGTSAASGGNYNAPSRAETQMKAQQYKVQYGSKRAKGGIVEKGEIALLEGDGAEAVVPLEKNTEWVGRVADMMTGALNKRQGTDEGISSALMSKFDELIQAISQQRIYLDSDVLVGEMTPALDSSLGQVYAGKARGK